MLCYTPRDLYAKTLLSTYAISFYYTVSKNILNIFDCNLKKNYKISIVFGTNIPATTSHQTTV